MEWVRRSPPYFGRRFRRFNYIDVTKKYGDKGEICFKE
jgi:hypothetical protein